MDEFIQMVTRQLGVSDQTGKSATGGILKMIQEIPQFLSFLVAFLKEKLGSELFASVAAKLPDLLGKK